MTPAASSPAMSHPTAGGGRIQGALVILALVLAVLATVVLVATPASSVGSGDAAPAAPVGEALPKGLRVEVRGGEGVGVERLADRLAAAGASLREVAPVGAGEDVGGRTTIVYYDRRSLPAAEQLRSLLGSGTLQRRQVFQPEVDVTIVLGKDLPRL